MKLMFLGAAHEVTGSCTLLSVSGKNILVDCGLEQGPDLFENCELPIMAADVDAVVLTHAHIDHSGKIPFLVKNGFDGPIYTTDATKRLCEIMLRDSAHIQEFEASWRNRRAKRSGEAGYTPLYTVADADKALSMFEGCGYGREVTLFDGIKIEFFDAGHLLGSSSVLFHLTEDGVKRTLLFSGDLGNPPRPLIRTTAIPPRADYAVVESTYGDRLHEERGDIASQFTEIIQRTLDRGGNVIIPSFAVGRTQEILYLIRMIKDKGLIKGHDRFPVYLDSPLAVEATRIYASGVEDYLNEEALELLERGVDPIQFDGLKLSVTDTDSKAINIDKTPKVIISASGMCEAGRIRHHLKHGLWRKNNTVLFVGYQTEGTIGRKLLDGAEYVKLFGEDISVKAEICRVEGVSSHADRDMLLEWLSHVEAKKVFVNHGENTVCDAFAATAGETFNRAAVAPYSGDVFDLIDGEYLQKATVHAITRKVSSTKRARMIYDDLVSAGERLARVIKDNQGGTNKELSAFTAQIKALCDKYERKSSPEKKAKRKK